MLQVILNNQVISFAPNSLNLRVARKLIHALNTAYMRSISICSSNIPTEQTDRARFICAAQLVHDNCFDYESVQTLRNECIEKLRA